MQKKFYAVRAGRAPGVYDTWAQCQKQTSGFSGAVFKSFPTREEAAAFVKGACEKPDVPPATDAVAYVERAPRLRKVQRQLPGGNAQCSRRDKRLRSSHAVLP